MNTPQLNNIDLEFNFSNQKINTNTQITELFKAAKIDILSFMIEFRKCLIDQNFEWLVQLWINNYEPKNQNWVTWFDIISALLKIAKVDITADFLLELAKDLNIQNEISTATLEFNERLNIAQEK